MYDFNSLHQKFQPLIFRYLCHFCNESDAPDLTQTVFLKVSESLPKFRAESSLKTWIFRIATNVALDHVNSGSFKQQARELSAEGPASVDEFPDLDTPVTEEKHIRQEMSECIRGVINQLPETYRTVLLLSDFEGLSNAEIAEVLCDSAGAVKIRLHRSRAALRKALEGACSFYHDQRSELMCDRKQNS